MKALGRDGYLDCVILFFELTEELLAKVMADPRWFLDLDFLKLCHEATGPHAHIFSIYNTNGFIRSWVKRLGNKYDTVSWWDRKTQKFILRRGAASATNYSTNCCDNRG